MSCVSFRLPFLHDLHYGHVESGLSATAVNVVYMTPGGQILGLWLLKSYTNLMGTGSGDMSTLAWAASRN